jgi:diguanylate cyclase (GGDEF)-like protein
VLFLLGGAGAIFASYMAVIFGLAPAEHLGSVTVASIALPALVSGLVMTAFIATEAKSARSKAGEVHELHAQLARKEVELTRIATHDDLTGLYSRHHLDDNVNIEFKRAERHGRPLALLLVEIDDLAEMGERVGSLSKGYLLSEVASVLRTALRINDIGCRYAEASLAALLPETDADGAVVVANKIRAQLADREFLGRRTGAGFKLTVSQGAAAVPARNITSREEFLKAAETALVEAKTSGADQVRTCVPPPDADAAPTPESDEELLAG